MVLVRLFIAAACYRRNTAGSCLRRRGIVAAWHERRARAKRALGVPSDRLSGPPPTVTPPRPGRAIEGTGFLGPLRR